MRELHETNAEMLLWAKLNASDRRLAMAIDALRDISACGAIGPENRARKALNDLNALTTRRPEPKEEP